MKKFSTSLLLAVGTLAATTAVAGATATSATTTASATAAVNVPSASNTLCIGSDCTAIGFDATSLTVQADAGATASASSSAPILAPVYGAVACGHGGDGAGVRVTRPALGGPISLHLTIGGSAAGYPVSKSVDEDLSSLVPGGSRIVAICTR